MSQRSMDSAATAVVAAQAAALPDLGGSVPVYESFEDMPLNQALLRGIYSHGFEKPSPIQQRSIVPFLRGGDLIAQAQSGTGKTGAFSIGLLQRVDFRRAAQQAIVLSPTHELAQQTQEVVSALGEYLAVDHPGFCQVFVGGSRVEGDIRKLQSGAMVAVGTPGRVSDLIRRGALRTDSLKVIVLDEADEMLSQGFAEQIYEIFRYLPRDIQVVLYSATMPEAVLDITQRFMRDPTRILVNKEAITLDGIKQFYVAVTDDQQKMEMLADLYESVSMAQSMIFANSKRKVDYIAEQLNQANHTVSSLHAEMPKSDRSRVLSTFRSGSSRVLVSSDLVARGIDVHHVNVVINFDLPQSKENYIHRIGRSGRYGRKGVAINFVAPSDIAALKELEAHYRTRIAELPMDFAEYLAE